MIFVVHFGADSKARFRHAPDAHQYAQWKSTIDHCVVEVERTGKSKNGIGLVGQYKYGEPTPEFVGRGDNWFPAGPHPSEC